MAKSYANRRKTRTPKSAGASRGTTSAPKSGRASSLPTAKTYGLSDESSGRTTNQPAPAIPQKAAPTEWQRYLALIEPASQGIPLEKLSDKNIVFLSKKVEIPEVRIRMMRTAAQNAPALAASPELVYACERMGVGSTVTELMRLDQKRLSSVIKQAVEQGIVSSVGADVVSRVTARLRLAHGDAEPLSRIASNADDPKLATLVRVLQEKQIRTLGDLKTDKGYKAFLSAAIDTPGPAIEVLQAHVILSPLSPDRETRESLIKRGYFSLSDITSSSLREFVGATKGAIEPYEAVKMYLKGRALDRLIEKTALETRIALTRKATGNWTIYQSIVLNAAQVQAAMTACECPDCESALSPLAYLADLLKYCYDNLRDGAQRLDYARLATELHQKFGDLPADCGAVEEVVHQVRIAIEVLRSFLKVHPPAASAATVLDAAVRDYLRSTYEALLLQIGTSYGDLRLAQLGSTDEKATYAQRLGIRAPTGAVNHLQDLLLDVQGATTTALEDKIEQIFGLKDTTKDPLSAIPLPSLLAWRRDYVRDVWKEQDWPDDTPGDGVPLIDPDLIGVDDFRNPDPTRGAFKIWVRRRTWVDGLRASLLAVTPPANSSKLDSMLDKMFPGAGALAAYPLATGGTAAQRTWPAGTKTALLTKRNDLASADKTVVTAARSALASSYGLSIEGYSRLIFLRDKDLAAIADTRNAAPSDIEVKEFADILVQARKRIQCFVVAGDSNDWVTEETAAQASGANATVRFEFGARDFWISLTEPEVGDWPPADNAATPWIDPDTTKLTDLPDSAAGDEARARWDARRAQLASDHVQITSDRVAGFDTALATAFGALPVGRPAALNTWGKYVEDTLALLNSNDATEIGTAKTRLSTYIYLSEDTFRRLMTLRIKDASPDPEQKPTAVEYDEADLLLLSAHKLRVRYPQWCSNERTTATRLEAWQTLKARLPAWRAVPEDRNAWQSALRLRNKAAIIDPDLIASDYLLVNPANLPAAPTNVKEFAAYLWNHRQAELNANTAAIKLARENASATANQGFPEALAAAGTPPVLTRADLANLRAMSNAGKPIGKRLAQLGLDVDAFQYLNKIDQIVAANQTVARPEWDEVYAILVEVWKRRQMLLWRNAEHQTVVGIPVVLSPDCFGIPKPDPLTFPPPLPTELPRWRASESACQTWIDRLQARIDQDASLASSLAQIVDSVEEATLPKLRDALIAAVPDSALPTGTPNTLALRAKALRNLLLIDMSMGGCSKTTRVAQAIVTIQDLLFSVRDGFLNQWPRTWALTQTALPRFDGIWKWLGSYVTWRAAMFVLLYPENLTLPTLRREFTPAMNSLLDGLRAKGELSGNDAASAISKFSSYFSDVCRLNIYASEKIESHFVDERRAVPSNMSVGSTIPVRFLFGLAPTSGRVYWSIAYGSPGNEQQSPWRVLAPFSFVVQKILGTSVFRASSGKRYVFVFVACNENNQDTVYCARFDPDIKGEWSPAEAELVDTQGRKHFTAALLSTSETVAPKLQLLARKPDEPLSDCVVQIGIDATVSTTTASLPDGPSAWRPAQQGGFRWDSQGYYALPGGIAIAGADTDQRLVMFSLFTDNNTPKNFHGAIRVANNLLRSGSIQSWGNWTAVGPSNSYFGRTIPHQYALGAGITVSRAAGASVDDLIIVSLNEAGSGSTDREIYCRVGQGLTSSGSANWSSVKLFGTNDNLDVSGPCAVACVGRTGNVLNLLVAYAKGGDRKSIGMKRVDVTVTAGSLQAANPQDYSNTPIASFGIIGMGLGVAGTGASKLALLHWVERDPYGNIYGWIRYSSLGANGLPSGTWGSPIPVDASLYSSLGGQAIGAGLAVHSPAGLADTYDAIVASYSDPSSGSADWSYSVAEGVLNPPALSVGPSIATAQYKPSISKPSVSDNYDFVLGPARTEQPDLTVVASRNGTAKTRINQILVQEAYALAPLAIALQLQQSGNFRDALDWFRFVYDFTLPKSKRLLYPGLEPNPGGTSVYRDGDWKWLEDPLDPHRIAEGRNGTYERYVIQTIVRCLIEYADTEFTQDTEESITLARTLYLAALSLLDDPMLAQSYDGTCTQIREWLDFAIGELQNSIDKRDRQAILDFIANYRGNAYAMTQVATTIMGAYLRGEVTATDKSVINAAVTEELPVMAVRSLGEMITGQGVAQGHITRAVVAEPRFAEKAIALTEAIGNSIDTMYESTFGSKYSTGMFDLPDPGHVAYGSFPFGGGYTDPGINLPRLGDTPLTIGEVTFVIFDVFDPIGYAQGFGHAQTNVSPGSGPANTPPFQIGNVVDVLEIQACVPPNPVLRSLKLHAELNLYKTRTCRTITGTRRQAEPYSASTDASSGMPSIGAGGQLVLPGIGSLRTTPYRYPVLIERAKGLVQLAQQAESAMLAAIQAGETERYSALKAKQDLGIANANVKLQSLRVTEAQDGVQLSQLQQVRAQIQVDQYTDWIDQGALASEKNAAIALGVAMAADFASASPLSPGSFGQAYSAMASILQMSASMERRIQEWTFQRNLAQQDRRISDQQYAIAQDQVRVVGQEQTVATLNASNASDTVAFLSNKFTNTDLYEWMAGVLQGVYRYFLQQATGMARLAAAQLAFERQESPPPFIQADYWATPLTGTAAAGNTNVPDRRGLTGSIRLLQDITQLDQYAFTTDRRKLQIASTLSVAQRAPLELQQFRETGVLTFATPMEWFDREFPGQYLRLVHKVKVSLLALTPAAFGVRATLTTSGISRVVIGGDTYEAVRVVREPDLVALSSPREATGLFDLDIQPTMLAPFENIGVDTVWELRMPQAANPFDFDTIVDVVFTIEYTALHSSNYQTQVVQRLGRRESAQRSWSFKNDFPDQWYELNTPELSDTPMVVRFDTSLDQFPPNIDRSSLVIENVLLHVVRRDGARFELPTVRLRYQEAGSTAFVGGTAETIEGTISTSTGSAGSWSAMQTKAPAGTWELSLPDSDEIRARFKDSDILDLLLLVGYSGQLPEWPA